MATHKVRRAPTIETCPSGAKLVAHERATFAIYYLTRAGNGAVREGAKFKLIRRRWAYLVAGKLAETRQERVPFANIISRSGERPSPSLNAISSDDTVLKRR
ncbi:hypothetical protein EVAR_36803_1 [Eumeta japonica]|uniref:Uncharacterized protein n=1 Tax=Eumeta variegata TaxID=151549 RepID=A0A4C1WWF3_EUMVA|nr:hypothetical protein EVAR_36803_1 [Eumeta japonica]